jgi:ADP-ribose pyrophosphatase
MGHSPGTNYASHVKYWNNAVPEYWHNPYHEEQRGARGEGQVIKPDQLKDIEVVEEETGEPAPPFVQLRRLQLRHRYNDDMYSQTYTFDVIEGRFADAVAIVLYHIDGEKKVWVGLRRGVRPSIYLRKNNPAKAFLDAGPRLTYLELVAGGIEYEDLDSIGINGRAALEVKEEAGYEVKAKELISLGGGSFICPGFGMEKIHYRAVKVDPREGVEAEGDGHPLEEVGDFEFHELSQAISWCRSGEIEDAKTEIGLYRLANYLGYHPEFGLWHKELPPELRGRVRSLGLPSGKSQRIG